MLLSVIIPVYNCAPVIERCLNSIDYPDAEIIVVDDGSTDESVDVLKKYIEGHSNVCLIQKENGGVSSARNVGIEAANGKYLMFVDADDYIVRGGIKRIVQLAEDHDADVVKFSFRTMSAEAKDDKDSIESLHMTETVYEGAFEPLKRNDIPDYLVWDGIYRRSIIKDNNLRFQEDLCLHEDDVFMGELYCHTEKVVVTDLPLYRYVKASSHSSTHNQNIQKQRRLIESGYIAAGYRSRYVQIYCPEAIPLECLKYMRWVCTPRTALEAGYMLKEYKNVLNKFKEQKCWPLDYKWIHAARLDWSWKIRMKWRIKTFLTNHPGLAYILLKKSKTDK